MARVVERAKAARKHARRVQGLTSTGVGAPSRMLPEGAGGAPAAAERKLRYTPTSAVQTPQQFAIYGRSLTETEVIKATLAKRAQWWAAEKPGLSARAMVAPLATDPVVPFAIEERD